MRTLLKKLNITDRASFVAFLVQVLKFGCVGLLNSLISIAIYNAILYFDRNLYIVGNIFSWLVTVSISYVLNRKWVFKNSKVSFIRGLGKCYIVYLASLVVSSLLLIVWIELIGINEQIAQLINIVLMLPVNYFLNRFWTFSSGREA